MQGFWRHVHEDHNMWSYLYFVLYLDTLFENDRNALEAYVYKHVNEKKHLFLNLRIVMIYLLLWAATNNLPFCLLIC